MALAMSLGVLGSCGPALPDIGRTDRIPNGVSTVRVTITPPEQDRGNRDVPLPFTNRHQYTVNIDALGADGNPKADFNGTLMVSVSPGVLTGIAGAGVTGRLVRLTNGSAAGINVSFERAYGETRIYAEEQGYDLSDDPNVTPACADGMDNDGDGLADFPADPGCAAPNDNDERSGSYALGASEAIYIGTPTVDDIQGPGTNSPLLNQRVTIDRGTLVVTRISVSGFWVTDTSRVMCPSESGGMRRCASSLFAFNFRLPEGMRPCDRLGSLLGTVQEFTGTTQLAQPAWRIPADGLYTDRTPMCPIPEAVVLRPTAPMERASTAPLEEVLDMANMDAPLEPLENALVRVSSVRLSPNVGPERVSCSNAGVCDFAPGRSNCDQNGDGVVDFNLTSEALCANLCQTTVGCSEWTGWIRFGQMAVDFTANQPNGVQRFIVSPREAISNFNPLNQPFPGTAMTVTGTLKQVGPNWIIEPRCTLDLVFDGQGTVVAPNAACVTPRSIVEEP